MTHLDKRTRDSALMAVVVAEPPAQEARGRYFFAIQQMDRTKQYAHNALEEKTFFSATSPYKTKKNEMEKKCSRLLVETNDLNNMKELTARR